MPSRSVIAHRGTENTEFHRDFFKREVTEPTEDGFIIILRHRA